MGTTSGVANFVYPRAKIIKRALRQCGAIEAGEEPSADAEQDAADALNAMIKEWDALGIHVWTEFEAILFLQPGQSTYSLGGGSTDHCAAQELWVQTALTATLTAGATTLPVISNAGVVSGDIVGVALDDNAIYWTTVSGPPGQPPVGTIPLAGSLPSQASDNANVFAYAANIPRPLRVPRARRYTIAPITGQAIETPMLVMSRQDYMDLPNKADEGTPTQFFYAPLIGSGGIGPGLFYAWPTPIAATDAVRFTGYRQIQDFTQPDSVPDLPQEWINALCWSLAEEIGPEYDVSAQRWQIITSKAAKSLDRVTGWDREPESVLFGVAFDATSRGS